MHEAQDQGTMWLFCLQNMDLLAIAAKICLVSLDNTRMQKYLTNIALKTEN
jgi:hypothetical protein